MLEVKVPELGSKFQFGEKLVRILVAWRDHTYEHITYEENLSVENGCVTFIDINDKIHKLINVPVIIDYDYTSQFQAASWRNFDVSEYERDKVVMETIEMLK